MKPGMEPMAASLLVAYDCPATKAGERRRRALRKHLSPLERVQYSVYFGCLPRPDLPPLEQALVQAIEAEADRLLVVDLGAGTHRQYGLGLPALRLPPAALIIIAQGTQRPHLGPPPEADRYRQPEPELPPDEAVPVTPGYCERFGRQLDRVIGFGRWCWESWS